MPINLSGLNPLLDDVSDAVLLVDRDGRILDASAGVHLLFGYEVGELIGHVVFTLCQPDDVRRAESTYRALIDRPGQKMRLDMSARHKDGSARSLDITFNNRLDDPAVRAIIVTCRDLTAHRDIERERERHERHALLLSDMALEFAQYQDPASLFPVIARRCSELLGEWCVILSISTGNHPLRVEAVYHTDPRRVGRLRDVLDAFPLGADESITELILRDGRPFVLTRDHPDVGPENARRTAPFWALGIPALLSVPIFAAGEPLAVFSVGTEGGLPWTEEHLRLASLIGDRAGSALYNAQLIVAERVARQAAERTADWTDRLQRATADLSEALTVAQVADVVLDHSVAALGAQAGSISILNQQDRTLDLVNAVGYPDSVMRAWRHVAVSGRPVAAEAIRTREPVFLESKAALAIRYTSEATEDILPFDGARAIVPLTSRHDVLGVLSLSFPRPEPIAEDERALIVTMARQCAVALERAQLYEREHRVAEMLQRSLLPAELPAVPGIEIAARYLPAAPDAKVGGDWYDGLALADGRMAFVIGDVAGRGLRAASVMGRLRNIVRAYAIESGSPDELVRRVGRFLDRDEMVTLIYVILDPIARTATYANAGHVPPLLITPDGRAEFLSGVSVPLCRVHAPYHQHTVAVPDGSKLILYTDGLVEDRRRRSIDEGFDRLKSVVERHREATADVLAETIVSALSQDSERLDDVAVLVVSLEGVENPELVLRLPAVPESVVFIRRSLSRWLLSARVDPVHIQEIITAVGEASNNAIEHAYGAAEAEFSIEAARGPHSVDIVIRDQGQWRAPRAGRGGRGINLMKALMDSVEIERRPDGTTVRLRRTVPTGVHA